MAEAAAAAEIKQRTLIQRLQAWSKAVITLDRRSLAALRIGLGAVLLLNICDLAQFAGAFYSDDGLLPRAARMQLSVEEQFTAPPWWCSPLMFCGQTWFAEILLVLAAVLAVAVMVGYRTRWALFGSWLLLVGFQARNPLVLFGADDVLRCILFWSIFLPLGDRWSVDRWRRPRPEANDVCSLASAALILQLVCIYLFTGLLKSYPEWRTQHTAVYYALSTDHFTTHFGLRLLHYPGLLKCLTFSTLIWEVAGPLALLYAGKFRAKVRLAVVAGFIGLHLGLAATMSIGMFPLVCIVCWLTMLPGEFWTMAAWRKIPVPRLVSSSWANGCKRLASRAKMQLQPAVDQGNQIAANILLGLLLAYVVLLNVARLTPSIYVHLNPGPLRSLGDAAQLNQFWCMFAPRPFPYGGWFDIHGELADGTKVNLLQPDRPPQQHRPDFVCDQYPSMRWRKTLLNLIERDCTTYRVTLLDFLRRRWNDSHDFDRQLVRVDAIYQRQLTLLPEQAGGLSGVYGPTESIPLCHWPVEASSTLVDAP